jgi:hypothetical protein
VAPDPIPVELADPCAGKFGACSATEYLDSKWTVSVSAMNDVGGRGTLEVHVVDAASGQPLLDPAGSVSGDLQVLLGPRASVALPIEWRRPLVDTGAARLLPAQLAFVISVHLTDSMGNPVSETVTVPEKLPRPWQIF